MIWCKDIITEPEIKSREILLCKLPRSIFFALVAMAILSGHSTVAFQTDITGQAVTILSLTLVASILDLQILVHKAEVVVVTAILSVALPDRGI